MEIETYRSVVAPAHCDVLGHMNVSRYFAAVGDGMFSFQSAMGLTAEDIKSGRKISFAVVHAESDFRSEVLAGEVIFLTSAVEEIADRTAKFRHRLYRAGDGRLAFETHFTCVMLDLVTRKATLIPDAVREALRRHLVEAQR